MRRLGILLLIAAALLGSGALASAPAWAQDEAAAPAAPAEAAPAAAPAKADPGDTAWMLASSSLVMVMMPGLAMFYGGLVRKKNVLSTMMHSMVVLGIITIQWVVVGYSIAFGPSIGGFFGDPTAKMFLGGVDENTLSGTIPEYVFLAFQLMFAIITPALISGAYAERMKFRAFVIFTLLWATLVYDPICHMVWMADGWLFKMNAKDFAGGTVVHISSGVSALVMALLLGKRKGYPGTAMIPHNTTITLIGAGLLWFGWFGFNSGSALSAGASAGNAFLTTQAGAAAGAVGWILMEGIKHGKASALGFASGLVAGLVGITPAAGFVNPGSAILVGLGAGVICFLAVSAKSKFGYDDSLDAFGVHGVGGTWGALATGIFATVGAEGLLKGNPGQLWIQFVATAFTIVYAAVATFVIAKITAVLSGGLRVKEEEEEVGLDQALHGEQGYVG